jgi:hypothetical protein
MDVCIKDMTLALPTSGKLALSVIAMAFFQFWYSTGVSRKADRAKSINDFSLNR